MNGDGHPDPRRRGLLKALALAPGLAWIGAAPAAQARSLSFYHTHTDERLHVSYFAQGDYVRESLARIEYLLRDFRTGEVHAIDPLLLDILHGVTRLAGAATFEVISAYRSPATNAALRVNGGVARGSLHMSGRAIDVRLSGVATERVHRIAVALKAGGVGYYPRSDFVHLDTGRIRQWKHEAA